MLPPSQMIQNKLLKYKYKGILINPPYQKMQKEILDLPSERYCCSLRFKGTIKVDEDIEKYIKPLNRNEQQYGWYVYIDKHKADFGGIHIPLEKSKQNAKEFIIYLKNHLAKHLDAGNSLESLTTTL